MHALIIILLADSWARKLIRFFVKLGVFGPLLLETLDTSFFYLPLANELLFFALIHSGSARWMWIVYALMAAVGSVLGVLLLDLVVRNIGEEGIERMVGARKFERLKKKMEDRAGWALFISGMLPPPFPFRIATMTASALQSPRPTMLTAIFFGRLVRFSAEALLILYFGSRFVQVMESDWFQYVIYGFTVVATAGSVYTIYKLYSTSRPGKRAAAT